MTGICMRNVTHLSSDNILPVNIIKLYGKNNIIKKTQAGNLQKKHIGTSMEKEKKKEKTQIKCAGRYW